MKISTGNERRRHSTKLTAALAVISFCALPAFGDDSASGSLTFTDGEIVIGSEDIDRHAKKTCVKEDDDGLNYPVTADPLDPDAPSKDRCLGLRVGGFSSAGACNAAVSTFPQPVTCEMVVYVNLAGHCGNATGDAGWGEITFFDGSGSALLTLSLKHISLTYVGTNVDLISSVGKTNAGASQSDGTFRATLQVGGETHDGESLTEACSRQNGLDSFQADGFLEFQHL